MIAVLWTLFSSFRGYLLIGAGIAAWFIYGWGLEVISNYTEMPKQIEKLTRDKELIESRVASYKALLARRDAAIEASKCAPQIKAWIKDPEAIPGFKKDPFNPNAGG